MQTSVPIKPQKYTQGETHTYRNRVVDLMPLEDIPFGYQAARSNVDSRSCRMPLINVLNFNLDDDFDAGDFTVTMKLQDLDGNDTALTAIDETYASSHSAFADAVVSAITALHANVTAEALPDASGNAKRIIKVTATGDYKLIETVAAAHSGTATVTTTRGTADVQVGPAERDRNTPTILTTGTIAAPVHTANQKLLAAVVNGDPAVPVNLDSGDPILAGDPVYVLLEDYTDQGSNLNPRGTYRKNDDDGLAPVVLLDRVEFSDSDANGLAPVAINK